MKTASELFESVEVAAPDFVPFQNYVSGLTSADAQVRDEDLWLDSAIRVYFDDLDGAHSALQSLEGQPFADYLHGIIHRREGDFWNANYWFRRASEIGSKMTIDPEALTKRVESGRSVTEELRKELLDEWATLVKLYLQSKKDRA